MEKHSSLPTLSSHTSKSHLFVLPNWSPRGYDKGIRLLLVLHYSINFCPVGFLWCFYYKHCVKWRWKLAINFQLHGGHVGSRVKSPYHDLLLLLLLVKSTRDQLLLLPKDLKAILKSTEDREGTRRNPQFLCDRLTAGHRAGMTAFPLSLQGKHPGRWLSLEKRHACLRSKARSPRLVPGAAQQGADAPPPCPPALHTIQLVLPGV